MVSLSKYCYITEISYLHKKQWYTVTVSSFCLFLKWDWAVNIHLECYFFLHSYNCILTVMGKIHLFGELDPDFVGMLPWRSLPNREIFSQGSHDVDLWPMAEHSLRSGSAINECQISLPELPCPWVGIAPVQRINLYHQSESALDVVIYWCVRCGAFKHFHCGRMC